MRELVKFDAQQAGMDIQALAQQGEMKDLG